MTLLAQNIAVPAVAPAAPVGPSLEALQLRLVDVQTRVNALVAQRNVLVAATRNSSNPAIRASAENQLISMDLDLASARAELASLQAQVAARQGGRTPAPPTAVIVQPSGGRPFLDRIDPDALTAAFVMTVLAVLMPLSIGLARRLWRRPERPAPALDDKLSPRLDRLEQAVDTIAIEIERISEGQRFVTRVLTERPVAQAAAPQAESDGSALGDGKPFLALGAGPMEPIRVAERQGVKQSVTPH